MGCHIFLMTGDADTEALSVGKDLLMLEIFTAELLPGTRSAHMMTASFTCWNVTFACRNFHTDTAETLCVNEGRR